MASSNGTTVPIVFIHGWKASVLVDKNTGVEKFNYAFSHLLGLGGPTLDLPMEWEQDGQQAYDDMIASHPCGNVSCLCGTVELAQLYGPLLRHLAGRRGAEHVHPFAYDWRRELAETSRNFETFLKEIATRYGGAKPQGIRDI